LKLLFLHTKPVREIFLGKTGCDTRLNESLMNVFERIKLQNGVFAGLLLIDRYAAPRVERWGRGADGEEYVGRLLEGLVANERVARSVPQMPPATTSSLAQSGPGSCGSGSSRRRSPLNEPKRAASVTRPRVRARM
jgi:hypothetical protein